MFDFGLTHIALPVGNIDRSVTFYAKYARMQVVHRRTDPATESDVVWISDRTRPFVLVLIQAPKVDNPLLPLAHLGVACASREEVDRLCALAKSEDCLRLGPREAGCCGISAPVHDLHACILCVKRDASIDITNW